jgi:hypothetical protein
MVAPFVAAATFIGSMGNIPLATVLNANGVMFAGIMGFIYSDLMVPPLVMINARYYGWRVALYIAAVMFVSIVVTALALDGAFAALGITPQSGREIHDITRFALDYTFYLNVVCALLAAALYRLHRRHVRETRPGMDMGGGIGVKRIVSWVALAALAAGVVVHLL